jgi:hypothetical protein
VGWAGLGWTIEKLGEMDGVKPWLCPYTLCLYRYFVQYYDSRNRIAILAINTLSANVRTLRGYKVDVQTALHCTAQHTTIPL